MSAPWTLSVSDGRGGPRAPVAAWHGALPFAWLVLASARCRTDGSGVAGHMRGGLARFGKLSEIVHFARQREAPGLVAAMAANRTALETLRGQILHLNGAGGPPPAELRRLCVAAGRAVDSLRRDTFMGPRRFVNAARAGRGPLAPLAGLCLDDAGFDASGAALPMGLVFAAPPASEG
jgi:hypothetical protein